MVVVGPRAVTAVLTLALAVVGILGLEILSMIDQPVFLRPLRESRVSVLAGQQSTVAGDKMPIILQSYTLTGRTGPSIKSLQDQLTQCSLAMGLSQNTLDSNREALNTIATNLSLYLTALQSIIPQQFSRNYRSPCWNSRLVIPRQQHGGLGMLSQTDARVSPDMKLRERLYQKILEPALHRSKTVLLCLPAFFLAGFPKSGTTSLHMALYRHRTIAKPYVKEPHWWTRMPLADLDQNYLRLALTRYLQYFYDEANASVRRNHQLLVYDGSQSTLWDSNFFVNNQDYCAMPTAISHTLPASKFIVVMRNPVTRTFSHYLYSCSQYPFDNNWLRSNISKLFHERVVAEVRYFNECLSSNRTVFECASDRKFSIDNKKPCGALGYRLVVSLYYVHLTKWMHFFPRENFLFLRLEDMSKDPQTFMGSITAFLGIVNLSSNRARRLFTHRENKRRVQIRMLPETSALLYEFFHPFNQKLVELTGDKRFLWERTTIH